MNKVIEKNGKKYKQCSVCKVELELTSENYYIKKNEGRYHSQCKRCGLDRTQKKQKELKLKCIEYKGGKCCLCGYNRYAGSLEFHHIEPSKKDFGISDGRCYDFEKVKGELDKCILVCRNCHGEIHGGFVKIQEINPQNFHN